ncbi:MAG: metal ABC transporter permease [Desulfobacteraceae bacterium]|jgi:zinc transport system permease protein|nr:MAG: metal ABC transporter permease [Desulfobacteraceae bacterium]
MIEALQYEFMRNAVIAGVFASLICGIIGTFVVVNRLVFIAGGIAHAAFGGIGLAFFLGIPYLLGTLGFSLVAAVIMTLVLLKAKNRADTFIGVIWAVGMASGIILLDLTPGYTVNLMTYLFGSIIAVPDSDLWWLLGMAVFTIFAAAYFYRDLLAVSYDDEFARLRGVPVDLVYFLFICLIAVSIVLIIRVVGLILVIALLTIPPYIAEKYTRSLAMMMVLSSFLAMLFSLVGLWLAYAFNLTSGATIILTATVGFFLSLAVDAVRRRCDQHQSAA